MLKYSYWLLAVGLMACAPQEQVVFKKVLNIRVDAIANTPVLKADLVLFNPNKKGAKLKKINIDIFINDKKGGEVDQVLNQKISGNSEFIVPVEVKINMKELGLLDTLINIFGGKKYSMRMVGKIRVSVNGFAVSVPVDETQEIRIKF
jgi:LEA14-like dessication related protein